jgi:hypothetical protein
LGNEGAPACLVLLPVKCWIGVCEIGTGVMYCNNEELAMFVVRDRLRFINHIRV